MAHQTTASVVWTSSETSVVRLVNGRSFTRLRKRTQVQLSASRLFRAGLPLIVALPLLLACSDDPTGPKDPDPPIGHEAIVFVRDAQLHLVMPDGSGSRRFSAIQPVHAYDWSRATGLFALNLWDPINPPPGPLRGIVILNSDGVRQRAINGLEDSDRMHAARWSPDGLELAYTVNRPTADGGGTWVARYDDTQARRVSEITGSNMSWSPDGAQILYRNGCDLWLADPSGVSDPVPFDTGLRDCAYEPIWSPTNRIGVAVGDIYEFNRDGSEREVIRSACVDPPECNVSDSYNGVLYSPTGAKMALLVNTSMGILDLVDGTLVTIEGPAIYGYSWSEDGSRLAFGRNGNLEVVNSDGSGLHTVETGVIGYPTWIRLRAGQ